MAAASAAPLRAPSPLRREGNFAGIATKTERFAWLARTASVFWATRRTRALAVTSDYFGVVVVVLSVVVVVVFLCMLLWWWRVTVLWWR